MATDSAATMTTNVKAALTGFDFTKAPHAEELILAIMTEFKAQIAKMTVTHSGTTACGAGAGTESGTGTVV